LGDSNSAPVPIDQNFVTTLGEGTNFWSIGIKAELLSPNVMSWILDLILFLFLHFFAGCD
jgi:hypothetical protein